MSTVSTRVQFVVELSPEEFRLVGRALSGRLKSPQDIHMALQLNARLMEQRAKEAEEVLKQVGPSVERAQELLTTWEQQHKGEEE